MRARKYAKKYATQKSLKCKVLTIGKFASWVQYEKTAPHLPSLSLSLSLTLSLSTIRPVKYLVRASNTKCKPNEEPRGKRAD